MSTRSAIITQTPDGLFTGIYCHYDGYPAGVGQTLLDHYTHRTTVNELIELKDISSLGQRVKPIGPHSFSHPEKGTTIAYERDRGEEIDVVKSQSLDEISQRFINDYACEYIYFFNENSEWMCNNEPLKDILNKST